MVDKEQQNNYFGDMKGYIDKINSILAEKNSWKTIAFISSGISILAVSCQVQCKIGPLARSKTPPLY